MGKVVLPASGGTVGFLNEELSNDNHFKLQLNRPNSYAVEMYLCDCQPVRVSVQRLFRSSTRSGSRAPSQPYLI